MRNLCYICSRFEILDIVHDFSKCLSIPDLLSTKVKDRLKWRSGRAVECTGLENRHTERYRGFESLLLRHNDMISPCESTIYRDFYFLVAIIVASFYLYWKFSPMDVPFSPQYFFQSTLAIGKDHIKGYLYRRIMNFIQDYVHCMVIVPEKGSLQFVFILRT